MLMKRNYLLPNVCQRVGVCLGIVAALMLVVYWIVCLKVAFVSENADAILSPSARFTNFSASVIVIMLCTAVILMAFSREKYEDEMIDAVRKSSLMCVAYVSFLVFVTIPLVPGLCDIVTNLVNPSDVWHKTEWPRLDELSRTLKEPLIIFVFYEIVFRIRLAKLKKALKNEE